MKEGRGERGRREERGEGGRREKREEMKEERGKREEERGERKHVIRPKNIYVLRINPTQGRLFLLAARQSVQALSAFKTCR